MGWLLLLLLLLAPSASAEVLDLEALVLERCGPDGYRRDNGCAIELGDGTFEINRTMRLGRCEAGAGGVRNSVAIVGQGAGLITTQPVFPTAGTTLHWTGPAGQPVLEVCGSWFTLQHLTIWAPGASECIRLRAENPRSAIGHMSEIRSVVLDGCQTAIDVVTANQDDQVDLLSLERVSTRNVEVGYRQDSAQTVGNDFRLLDIVSSKRGFEIRGGSFVCRSCYVGQQGSDPSYIGFYFTTSAKPGRGHHQATIETSHMEVRTGRFVVADHGTSRYPIALRDNSFQQLCTPAQADSTCEMTVVDVREEAPVTIHSNVFQGSNPTGKRPTPRMCSRSGWRSSGNMVKGEVRPIRWGCL